MDRVTEHVSGAAERARAAAPALAAASDDRLDAALAAVAAMCAGDASAGPVGEQPPGIRFRWLAAPRSTVVQPGPVHAGMTTDPARELDRLFDLLVR